MLTVSTEPSNRQMRRNFAAEQILYPEIFGAIGDGSADDTSAIQSAVNSMSDGDILYIKNDHIITDSIAITNKTNIRITGTGSITLSSADSGDYIFQLVGTVSNLEIDSLILIGENNAAYTQSAIGNASGQTISNVNFHDLYIYNINVGISLNANLSGTYTIARVHDNYIYNIVGASSGQGYGIHLANATRVVVSNNIINAAQRHSIYQARGTNTGNIIIGNSIYNHRATGATVAFVEAISIARSSGVSVVGNFIENFKDGAIGVDTDDVVIRNILIANNHIANPQNAVACIKIGHLDNPSYQMYDIYVNGNQIYTDYDLFTTYDIAVFNGTRIKVSNNKHHAVDVDGTKVFILVGHDSYINSSDDCDHIEITHNTFSAEGGDTSATHGVNVCNELCDTYNSTLTIVDNIGLQNIGNTVLFDDTVTNENLVYNEYPYNLVKGFYDDGDTTPTVARRQFMIIANAGGTTITDFDDSKEGQEITLYFADGNTTIDVDATNIVLSGGVDLTPDADDILKLISVGGTWYESGYVAN